MQPVESKPESQTALFLAASHIVSLSLDPDKSIVALLQLLVQSAGFKKARVLLPDENNTLRIMYSYGLSAEENDRAHYAWGEGITGKVLATQKIALIPDVKKETEFLSRITDVSAYRNEKISYIALPIMSLNRAIGVLAVNRHNADTPILENDIDTLQVFTAFIQQSLRIDKLVRDKTQALNEENTKLRSALTRTSNAHDIVGESRALKSAMQTALQAANSSATILLVGESGTGKEKFARMIHFASQRKARPFIAINCASIPDNLLESELFGHEKGAFTGALQSKTGKFEAASGGTLFLDEIGDMNPDLQSKLLRSLQEMKIQRIGSLKEIDIDVRVIAATHQNLKLQIERGNFRLDLFYRLNVLPIELPPLRKRGEDVRLLALYFLQRATQRHNKNVNLSSSALALLENYSWPGNIRQLENVVERIVILSNNSLLTDEEIHPFLDKEEYEPDHAVEQHRNPEYFSRPYMKIDQKERDQIVSALRASRGNKTQAALSLGLTPRQFQYRMQKLNIVLDPV